MHSFVLYRKIFSDFAAIDWSFVIESFMCAQQHSKEFMLNRLQLPYMHQYHFI